MSVAVTVQGLTRVYPGSGGIRDITFTAEDRAVTAVIGPNGAGKTVLFGIIAGLTSAQSGAVSFASADMTMAYCPDVPQFEFWLTAREVVETSLAVSRTNRPVNKKQNGVRAEQSVQSTLRTCGLGAVLDRRVADFSRGMLQRLGIAAALVTDPDILILDEPNSALDPLGRADVRKIITEQKRHRCIMLSSHLLSEIEQLADRIVVLDHGSIVTQGTTASILTNGLEPVWTVRLGTRSPLDIKDLDAAVLEASFTFETDTLYSVRFRSFAHAEIELITALQAFEAPIIEVTLRDRDLDASFARIIQNREHS